MTEQQIEIFQTADGQAQIEVRFERETIWLSQAQMAELFDKDSDTIGLHLKNIFKSKELEESATTEKSSVVRHEGNRQIRRKIKFYNLDAIISVGYRVNSVKGTQFRIWATQRLREYLVQGFSIDRRRFEKNAARSPELTTDAGRGLVDIISRYTQSFLWLQRYDEGLLEEPTGQSGGILLAPDFNDGVFATIKHQPGLMAADDKQRVTDVATAETLLRLVQSVPSPKAEPIKLWLAKVGYERMQEMADPSRSLADRIGDNTWQTVIMQEGQR